MVTSAGGAVTTAAAGATMPPKVKKVMIPPMVKKVAGGGALAGGAPVTVTKGGKIQIPGKIGLSHMTSEFRHSRNLPSAILQASPPARRRRSTSAASSSRSSTSTPFRSRRSGSRTARRSRLAILESIIRSLNIIIDYLSFDILPKQML